MRIVKGKFFALVMMLLACALVEGGWTVDYGEARSMRGGRSFRMAPKKAPPTTMQQRSPSQQNQNRGGFSRGLMGGLVGGALGGLLFGSMFGMGGSGMGILPILLLAGAAWFLFRRLSRQGGYGRPGSGPYRDGGMGGQTAGSPQAPPVPPAMTGNPAAVSIGSGLLEEGLEQIRDNEPDFDPAHFQEVASDVFFQVQAGWMRRDLDSYRHLLGEQLAAEYASHFARMRQEGTINKLESIAVRSIEIVEAGSDGREDFVTVEFTASLLDYTVSDSSGELVEGSMTEPVKFQERWTWARPVGTQDWKLEGITQP